MLPPTLVALHCNPVMSTPLLVKIFRDGKEIGTYDLAEVLRLLGLGTLKPTDIYWHEGMGGWELLSKLDASEGLRLPAEPEVKPQSDNESESIGACCGGCGLLIFLICGFCSVYCFLAVDAGHFHMFGVFGIIVGYIFGWISLIGLFIAIAFYRKKKAKA